VQVLRQLPRVTDRNVIVGSSTADDAGVYRLDAKRALVQTLDFFTPIVDDAYTYGLIAATNSLSDVYAMGGTPLTAMNIVGMPQDLVPPETIAAILRGGAVKCREARCALVGGHSIKNPEPIYGLSVTGIVHPRRVLTNAGARPGDALILTKPLGTGILTTGIKRGKTPPAAARAAIRSMTRLNNVGTALAATGHVHALTDVTGFGLLGHLRSMCRESGVGAELWADGLPALPHVWELITADCVPGGTHHNLEHANEVVRWDAAVTDSQKYLLADAQTSGGLLISASPRHADAVIRLCRRHRTLCAVVIGRITREKAIHVTNARS
jgi:selenide,water dikinase